VTIEQLAGMFNWEPHTTRAAISVVSKRRGVTAEAMSRWEDSDSRGLIG
jgi:hypothetical protein